MIEWLENAEGKEPEARPADSAKLRNATAQFRAGRNESALSTIERDGTSGLSPAAHALRSDIFAALGRRSEALDAARLAAQARPGRTDLSLRLAQRLVEANRAGEAVAELHRALEVPSAAGRILAGIAALDLDPEQLRLLYASARAAFLRQLAANDAAAAAAVEPIRTEDEIVRALRNHVADWSGRRATPDALIVGRNVAGRRPKVFWCCSAEATLAQLSRMLGDERPVFAMRSGHLIIGYADAEVAALASRYAREIAALQPDGSLVIGGNCQGAFLARAIALELRKAGRVVSKLILMEESAFRPYDGPVALIFGRESSFNPYSGGNDPDTRFASAYPAGYTVDFVDGMHNELFEEKNSATVASVLESILKQLS